MRELSDTRDRQLAGWRGENPSIRAEIEGHYAAAAAQFTADHEANQRQLQCEIEWATAGCHQSANCNQPGRPPVQNPAPSNGIPAGGRPIMGEVQASHWDIPGDICIWCLWHMCIARQISANFRVELANVRTRAALVAKVSYDIRYNPSPMFGGPAYEVANVRIAQPSGLAAFDQAAERAIRELNGSSRLAFPRGTTQSVVHRTSSFSINTGEKSKGPNKNQSTIAYDPRCVEVVRKLAGADPCSGAGPCIGTDVSGRLLRQPITKY